LGISEARSAAIFEETALPPSSPLPARIGASAGGFCASTTLEASPAAAPEAGVVACPGSAGVGVGGAESWAAAGAAAAMIARSIFKARFMMTL